MSKKRNGSLDLLKFLFALMIVFFHGKNLSNDGTYIFTGGNIGVEFFFIVSGCLMAASATRKEMTTTLGRDTKDFIIHKIKGLMPNYYVAFIIAFLVVHRDVPNAAVFFGDLANSIWELLLITATGLGQDNGLNNGPVWYLSAMLLAMIIIWPLMRKYKDTFLYIIAPVALLILLGFTYHNWAHFGGANIWFGQVLKGTVRAFMGILIGSVIYLVSSKLQSLNLSKLSIALLSIAEISGYISIFVINFYYGRNREDWLYLFLLSVCVTITMSNVSIWATCLQGSVCSWLGVFSYSLYLGHGFWSSAVPEIFPNMTYWERMPIYLGLAFGTGLFIHFVSIGLRRLWANNSKKIKAVFINS